MKRPYFASLYYKSYAPYFYGRVSPPDEAVSRYVVDLINGTTDRPVYIASKIQHQRRIQEQFPQLTLLYSKKWVQLLCKESLAPYPHLKLVLYHFDSLSS